VGSSVVKSSNGRQEHSVSAHSTCQVEYIPPLKILRAARGAGAGAGALKLLVFVATHQPGRGGGGGGSTLRRPVSTVQQARTR
jgi:hypothetical protein